MGVVRFGSLASPVSFDISQKTVDATFTHIQRSAGMGGGGGEQGSCCAAREENMNRGYGPRACNSFF